jgi:hypothetical protein
MKKNDNKPCGFTLSLHFYINDRECRNHQQVTFHARAGMRGSQLFASDHIGFVKLLLLPISLCTIPDYICRHHVAIIEIFYNHSDYAIFFD